MRGHYLKFHLMPTSCPLRTKLLRPSPGDGLKGLQSSPIWF